MEKVEGKHTWLRTEIQILSPSMASHFFLYLRSERTVRLSRDVYALTGKTGTGIRDAEGSTEVEE